MRRHLLAAVLAALLFAPVGKAWTWPAAGAVLQPFLFDSAHPYASGQHRGLDVGGEGGATVLAPAPGTVTFAGTVPSSGKSVTISTADGYAVTLTHLGSITVARGAAVAEGDGVGTIGPSGEAEVADPYVHLGVRIAAEPQGYLDPLTLLPARVPAPAALVPPVVVVQPPPAPLPVAEPAPAPVADPEPVAPTVAAPDVAAAAEAPVALPDPPVAAPDAPVADAPAAAVPEAPVAVPEATVAAPEATVAAPGATVAAPGEAAPVGAPGEPLPAGPPPAAAPAPVDAPGESLPAESLPAEPLPAEPPAVVGQAAAAAAPVESPAVPLAGDARHERRAAFTAAIRAAASWTAVPLTAASRTAASRTAASRTAVAAEVTADPEAGANDALRHGGSIAGRRLSQRARVTRAQRTVDRLAADVSGRTRSRPATRVHGTAHAVARIVVPVAAIAHHAVPRRDGVGLPLFVAAALLAAVVLTGMLGAVRMMVRCGTDTKEDPGRSGVAVCSGSPSPWSRGGLRRPVGRVRPLSPAEGQRRPHGERHGRARHAGNGGRRQGGQVVR
jgi:hypothetical protein